VARVSGRWCRSCGISNEGPALYNGKVFRGMLDAHLVALGQTTGKEIRTQEVAEWKDGFSITGAQLVKRRRKDVRMNTEVRDVKEPEKKQDKSSS